MQGRPRIAPRTGGRRGVHDQERQPLARAASCNGWYEKIQKSRWETVDESERFDLWDLDRDGTLDRSEVVKRAIERSRVDEAVAVERSCSDGVDGSCSDGEEGEEGDADEEDDEEDDEERDEL